METRVLWYRNGRYTSCVLTVPMRNGNWLLLKLHLRLWAFLPYLWGMETVQTLTEQINGIMVLTVPMRNGNDALKGYFESETFCSYRTYEEWKPSHFLIFNLFVQFLPYLWGMETFFHYLIKQPIVGSYRTYEEWKLVILFRWLCPGMVLTVPMRNGNFPTPF